MKRWLRPRRSEAAPALTGSALHRAPPPRVRFPRVRWWALGGMAAGLIGGSVAFAPAAWLAAAVARATQGHLLLAEARGTVWSGDAVPVLTDGQDSRNAMALPDRLHWQLGLSGLGVELRLRQACCLEGEPRLRLSGGPGRWQVEIQPGPAPSTPPDASPDGAPTGPGAPQTTPPISSRRIGHFPAAWLAGLGTPWNTMQLEGDLAITTPGLTLASAEGRWRLTGSAVLDVQHLSSRLSTLPELGSYRLNVVAQEPTPRLSLITLDGALRLGGTGEWLATGLRFRGEASAAAGSEAVLANLLNIIGRRQGARSLIAIG